MTASKVTKANYLRLVAILIGAVSGFQTYGEQALPAGSRGPAPIGIHEGRYVPIGGIKQWIQIRGENRNNPVLLFVHGGPGGSTLALGGAWLSWEKSFTVVHWDQRGAGMTYLENGDSEAGTMTVARMTDDGIEVAEFLRSHLHKDKIVLVGHSWGSILGIGMIKKRPELFAAYVGTGQVVNGPRNAQLNYIHELALAHSAHDDLALAELTELGSPPYRTMEGIGTLRKWGNLLSQGSGDPALPRRNPLPDLAPGYFEAYRQGAAFSVQQLGRYLGSPAEDLPSLGLDFAIPIFFFEGTADQITPTDLAEEYFNEIRAPHKEFVRFEGDHHFVAMNRPDEFLHELRSRVLPWANQAH